MKIEERNRLMEYIRLVDPRASDIKQQTGSHVINNVYLILHLNNTLLAMSHKGNGVENTSPYSLLIMCTITLTI